MKNPQTAVLYPHAVRRSLIVIAVFCAWLGFCHPARAWNAEGHMVTAQIAYNHLTPAVKARCDLLIAQTVFDASAGNSNFVTAACWADDIKSQTTAFSPWHFVDYPLSVDGTSTNGYVVPSSNVVWAINNCIAALQNPATSISNQAVNLRFLIHFMGDITQPLHCSDGVSARHPNGDAGGNSFSLSVSPGNLHSLWDEGGTYLTSSVTRPFTVASMAIITGKAADVEATYPYSVGFTSLQNVTNWAVEAWNLARTVTYVGITENSAPSALYLSNTASTSKQRMAVGGGRLADLLNLILARTNVVMNTLDSGPGSLRDTLANSQSGDIIAFSNTLSGQSILLTNGAIVLSNNVTIDGSALANGIQINGNGTDRVFALASNSTATLTGLIITNGFGFNPPYGGGVINYATDSTLTMNRCTVARNFSPFEGGGLYNVGTAIVNECTFTGNATGVNGAGGVYNDGIMILNQSTVSGNTSTTPSTGSGVVTVFGTLAMTNTIVAGNSSPSGLQLGVGTFTGANNITNGNPLLAALGNYGGPTPTMPPLAGSPAIDAGSDSAATGFATDQRGHSRLSGAHVDIGAVEVNPNTIVTTVADNGATGSLRYNITNVSPGDVISFAPNLSGQVIPLTNGGAIILTNNVSIDASSLANGIQISGTGTDRVFAMASNTIATLTALTITNGFAFNPIYGGGVINYASDSTLTLNRCTVVSNFAPLEGGGLYNVGTTIVNECTFSENFSGGNGGAGIYNDGTMTINQSTISGNSSTTSATGSGVVTFFGALKMTNTIVAGNTAPSSLQLSYGSFTGAFNLTNGNPMLATLGNYGGPTPTMPPLPGSPAVDAGSEDAAAGFTIDQRGYPRVADGVPDIGAVEGVYVATSPGKLTNPSQPHGLFQFNFTSSSGANLPVLASTNLSLASSNWTQIGFATESPAGSGHFQFTDPQTVQRFYRVKSP